MVSQSQAPPPPEDLSESPYSTGNVAGWNGGADKRSGIATHTSRPQDSNLLPTHYRRQERELTYSQVRSGCCCWLGVIDDAVPVN